jgi:hypothetical protein
MTYLTFCKRLEEDRSAGPRYLVTEVPSTTRVSSQAQIIESSKRVISIINHHYKSKTQNKKYVNLNLVTST